MTEDAVLVVEYAAFEWPTENAAGQAWTRMMKHLTQPHRQHRSVAYTRLKENRKAPANRVYVMGERSKDVRLVVLMCKVLGGREVAAQPKTIEALLIRRLNLIAGGLGTGKPHVRRWGSSGVEGDDFVRPDFS